MTKRGQPLLLATNSGNKRQDAKKTWCPGVLALCHILLGFDLGGSSFRIDHRIEMLFCRSFSSRSLRFGTGILKPLEIPEASF